MDFLKKFKKNSKLLFLLLLGLALLLLILFIIFVGFGWWFWILLVLWILFFFRLKVLYLLSYFWLIVLALVIINIAVIIDLKVNTNSSASSESASGSLVSCTSDLSDSPTTIAGYKAVIFSQPVDYSGTADTGVRTLSIKNLDAGTGDDIFFHIEKNDGGLITGAKGLIEVCDKDNMTQKYSSTKDSTTDGAGSSAIGATYYMHGNDKVTEPGIYRVDGYANVDGTWKLVGRVSDITITE